MAKFLCLITVLLNLFPHAFIVLCKNARLLKCSASVVLVEPNTFQSFIQYFLSWCLHGMLSCSLKPLIKFFPTFLNHGIPPFNRPHHSTDIVTRGGDTLCTSPGNILGSFLPFCSPRVSILSSHPHPPSPLPPGTSNYGSLQAILPPRYRIDPLHSGFLVSPRPIDRFMPVGIAYFFSPPLLFSFCTLCRGSSPQISHRFSASTFRSRHPGVVLSEIDCVESFKVYVGAAVEWCHSLPPP